MPRPQRAEEAIRRARERRAGAPVPLEELEQVQHAARLVGHHSVRVRVDERGVALADEGSLRHAFAAEDVRSVIKEHFLTHVLVDKARKGIEIDLSAPPF